jgi:hypothetical protein
VLAVDGLSGVSALAVHGLIGVSVLAAYGLTGASLNSPHGRTRALCGNDVREHFAITTTTASDFIQLS